MVLVVRRIVLAIPARWEEDLCANTVKAVGVHIGFIRKEVAVHGRLRRLLIVETIEAKRLLSKGKLRFVIISSERFLLIWYGSGKVTQTGVSSEHTKAFWESFDGLSVIVEEKVVCKHSSYLLNNLNSTILV